MASYLCTIPRRKACYFVIPAEKLAGFARRPREKRESELAHILVNNGNQNSFLFPLLLLLLAGTGMQEEVLPRFLRTHLKSMFDFFYLLLAVAAVYSVVAFLFCLSQLNMDASLTQVMHPFYTLNFHGELT